MHITEFSEKQEKQEEGISEEGAAGMSKDHIGPRKCGGD